MASKSKQQQFDSFESVINGIELSDEAKFSFDSGTKVVSSVAMKALQDSIEQAKQKLLEQSSWNGEFSTEEIQALIERMPFLQLCDSHPDEELEAPEVAFIRAKTGWLVHDYWYALSTSPGEHLFNTDMIDEGEDGKGGRGRSGVGMPPGVGTIVRQGFDTVTQMIGIAKQRGWKGIYIADGQQRMKWAAWVAAMEVGMQVYNFTPTEQERDRLSRLRRNEVTISKLRSHLKSRNSLGTSS